MGARWLSALVISTAACGELQTPSGAGSSKPQCMASLALKPIGTGDCTYCPNGEVFEPTLGQCIAVGPPECRVDRPMASDLDGSTCTPRWCPVRVNSQGQACAPGTADCRWEGDSCATAKAGGLPIACPAGSLPTADGSSSCTAAGDDVRDVNGLLPDAANAPLNPVPAPTDLPATTLQALQAGDTGLPIVCRDGTGEPHDCARGESGCPVGYLPAAGGADLCDAVRGPDWNCPPGFVQTGKPDFEAGLTGCAPDPGSCGSAGGDGFAWLPDEPGVLYVSAANTAGPWSGSRTAPYNALGPALAAAKGAGKVAVAAGSYKGNFVLTGTVQVVGRCAKLVLIEGTQSAPTFAAKAQATGAQLRGLTIRGGFGGIAATDGAQLSVTHAHVVESAVNGVYVSGGAHVTVAHAVVADVQPHPDGSLGIGMLAVKGAKVTIDALAIHRARLMAVYVEDPGTLVDGADLLLYGTLPDSSKALGNGLVVSDGGKVDVLRFRAHANPGLQVLAMGAGTLATLRHARIDHSQTGGAYKQLGFGLAVSEGGALAVHDGLVLANTVTGAIATGAGSTLALHRVHLGSTQPAGQTGELGDGLDVAAGAHALLNGVRITGNRSAGVRLYGVGSTVSGMRVLVDHTLPSAKNGILGLGINVLEGAHLELQQARVAANRSSGLVAQDPGSRIVASDLVVDNTGAEADSGGLGQGLVVSGAHAILQRAVFAHNHGIGIGVELQGARLDAAGLVVRDTKPREKDGLFGVAVQVRERADLSLYGSSLRGGHLAGVLLAQDATATLVGVTIADVQPQVADGIHGGGMWVAHGALAKLRSCAVRNLASAALATRLGTLDVRGSVLHGVAAAPTWSRAGNLGPVVADGVLAIDARALQLTDTLIGGYGRAGAMVDGPVQTVATTTGCAWSGGAFGLVLQRKASLQRKATWISGASQQSVASDSGLSVPEAPALAELSLPAAPKPGF